MVIIQSHPYARSLYIRFLSRLQIPLGSGRRGEQSRLRHPLVRRHHRSWRVRRMRQPGTRVDSRQRQLRKKSGVSARNSAVGGYGFHFVPLGDQLACVAASSVFVEPHHALYGGVFPDHHPAAIIRHYGYGMVPVGHRRLPA